MFFFRRLCVVLLVTISSAFCSRPAVIGRVQAFLNGLSSMTASFDQVDSFGPVVKTAKFYLRRKNGILSIKVHYEADSGQIILVRNDSVTVFDKKKKKSHAFHISQTPIYAVLSGKLDLSKERYEIVEDSDELLRIKIIGSSMFGGVDVILVFSKYLKTGNIQKLLAWIIINGTSETLISFYPDSTKYNATIPDEIFSSPF